MKEQYIMKNTNENFILTIETTSDVCGVSIICNKMILFENNINNGYNHSITLFDNINNALIKSNIDMSNIGKIVVSNGPGSFTGIRIGVAAALGLSEMYNTDVYYADTLDSIAYNVKNKNDIIISMIDAKCERAYISLYYSNTLKKVDKDYIVSVDELCNELNRKFCKTNICFSLVGSGAINYKNIFIKKLKTKFKIYKNESKLKASSLGFIKCLKLKIPSINYLLSSKAERERYGKS